jgi:hypothetical protein
MRKVVTSLAVQQKIDELQYFLIGELKLSEKAALGRIRRIRECFASLGHETADYALCRFRYWRALGYRCITSGGWVFAYETVPEGIIIQDMAHGKTLRDID